MAHNGASRLLSCRSCRFLATGSITPSKPFSSTAQRPKTIPKFTQTSSPDLDALLQTYRAKLFTPFAMNKTHRHLLYRAKGHKILLADPGVTVTLSDGEEIKLLPMDPKDRPRKAVTLQQLLSLLHTKADWSNFPEFLRGMKMAHQPLPRGYLQRFVRRSNEQDLQGIFVRCAEMVDETGVSLADPDVMHEMMIGVHQRAAKGMFQPDKLLGYWTKQMEKLTVLMQQPGHCGQSSFKNGLRDTRKDPAVLGVKLALKAASENPLEGSPIWASAPRIVEEILKVSKEWDLAVSQDVWQMVSKQLEGLLPLWAGLKLAIGRKVVEGESEGLQNGLSELADRLTKVIEEGKQIVEKAADGNPRRSLLMYNGVKDL